MKSITCKLLFCFIYLLFSSNLFAQSGFGGYPFNPSIDIDGAISTHSSDTTDVHGQTDMDNPTFGTVTEDAFVSSEVISQTGVEYPVWEAMDSNGDVVASCTVECSVLTNGEQVCQIHYYVMSNTPGTLTEEFTIDVDSD